MKNHDLKSDIMECEILPEQIEQIERFFHDIVASDFCINDVNGTTSSKAFGFDAFNIEAMLSELEINEYGADYILLHKREIRTRIEQALKPARFNKEQAESDIRKTFGIFSRCGLMEHDVEDAPSEKRVNYSNHSGLQPHECRPTCGKCYTKSSEILEQIDRLRQHWPNLNPDAAIRYIREVYPRLDLPKWVEGPFAVVKPGFFSDQYEEEVKEILTAIAKDRGQNSDPLSFWKTGSVWSPDLSFFKQVERSTGGLLRLSKQQSDSDILILPAQFGARHTGRSINRVRRRTPSSEIPLGVRDVGTMILTNPIRFSRLARNAVGTTGALMPFIYEGDRGLDLGAICAGDRVESSWKNRVPVYHLGHRGLSVQPTFESTVILNAGAITAFVPSVT